MKRAEYNSNIKNRWKAYKLPKSMDKKSFLDVGCWAGGFVRHAVELGASWGHGVDAVHDDDWETHVASNRGQITFSVLDALGHRFNSIIPPHDVVLCSGVLYHVSNPVELLRRLKNRTKELCVIETVVSDLNLKLPVLQYCPGDSFDRNPSNWFLPNEVFLRDIMEEVGFEIVDSFPSGGSRLCLHLKPYLKVSYKYLPRRKDCM